MAAARGRGGGRWWIALFLAAAVLTHLPVLRAPFFLDDFTQSSMMDGKYPSHPRLFDLYDFIDDSNRAALLERGILPWWAHPHMVVHFMRPLSSALVWLDYRLFGKSALWDHAHSLAWWAAASIAVHMFLRRSFSRRVAWLGAACFALSPCHVVPLAWLANRSALVSLAFGIGALGSYARWRELRRPLDALAALILFSLAMLGGEYGLCFGGYVVAIEAVRRRESLWRRASGIACFAIPAVAYVAVHAAQHYGAHGTGFYRDPIRDFSEYAPAVPRGLAVLIASAWLGVDGASWAASPGWEVALLGVATVAALAIPVARTLRGLDAEQRGRAAWMLLGSVLSLAPVLAVELSARVLGVSMVGISAIVALVLDRAWFAPAPGPRRGVAELTGLVALILGFVHIVRAPLDTWLAIRETVGSATLYNRRIAWVREHAAGKSAVIVLRADLPQSIFFLPVMLSGMAP
ncbi:MAG: hypothetical protein ACREJ3_01365, partial [Polyangiaceae bacterium]